jgi:hypothetical protein
MELFRQRAAQSYLDIFRAFCQNRCRVRRTLFHSLQDWETVQIDAEEIDQLLQLQTEEQPLVYPPSSGVAASHSLPLSSWAYHYKLRLMEWTVQLGFELEIYQPSELSGMYWYLSHLSKIRAQHIERIKFFTAHRLDSTTKPPRTTTTPPTQQYTRSQTYLHLTTLEASITSELATSLNNLYTALTRLNLIVPPPQPYSTDALRYEVRMKPFAPIGLPELPSFETYTRAVTRPDTSTAALLDRAAKAAGLARQGLEVLGRMGEGEVFAVGGYERWVGGVRGWMRAAIAVGVAVGGLRRAVEAAGVGGEVGEGEKRDLGVEVEVPTPEKGYHEWWIVPRVTEKKKKA